MEEIKNKIKEKMTGYYTDYYKNKLGLKDYLKRVEARLNEEEGAVKTNIERIKEATNYQFDKTKKVLIIGGGTGAEFVRLSEMGCDVYTVEPNKEAIEIIQLKCKLHNLKEDRIYENTAENLPFAENFFDFIYCFAVIEHVKDVEKSIKEAIRVTKKKGYLSFYTPDYRQIYEPHYKLIMPLFLPKWILKIILSFFYKRPADFLDTLQFVTAKQLKNIFRKNNVIALQIYLPYTKKAKKWQYITRWIQDNLEIEESQFWILIKN